MRVERFNSVFINFSLKINYSIPFIDILGPIYIFNYFIILSNYRNSLN